MGVFFALFLYLVVVELATANYANLKFKRIVRTLGFSIGVMAVLAFRSPMNGTDLVTYCPMFLEISKLSMSEAFTEHILNYDRGFIVYNKLVSFLVSDIQSFLAITAVVMILPVAFIIYKYSKNVYLSFMIFLCFGLYLMCFSGLRQAMAFTMTFGSFYFLVKRKMIPFVMMVALASLCHISALVFIFTWFIRNVNLPLRLSLIILAGYILIVIPSMRIVVPYVSTLLFGEDRYGHYYDDGGAFTMALVYLVIFLLSYTVNVRNTPVVNLLRWMILFAVIMQGLGIISTNSITRIAYYFSIFFCLFIPEILSNLRLRDRQILNPFVACLMIVFFYMTASNGYLNIVPYHFFWETGWSSYHRIMF